MAPGKLERRATVAGVVGVDFFNVALVGAALCVLGNHVARRMGSGVPLALGALAGIGAAAVVWFYWGSL